jgi:hypothetical protein
MTLAAALLFQALAPELLSLAVKCIDIRSVQHSPGIPALAMSGFGPRIGALLPNTTLLAPCLQRTSRKATISLCALLSAF